MPKPPVITREDVRKAVDELWANYKRWAANDLIKPGPPRGFRLSLELEFDGGRGIYLVPFEKLSAPNVN